jgi:hypothetical protein
MLFVGCKNNVIYARTYSILFCFFRVADASFLDKISHYQTQTLTYPADYEMLLALDESAPPVKPRGSQELVSSLPTIHVTAAWLNEGNAAHEVRALVEHYEGVFHYIIVRYLYRQWRSRAGHFIHPPAGKGFDSQVVHIAFQACLRMTGSSIVRARVPRPLCLL